MTREKICSSEESDPQRIKWRSVNEGSDLPFYQEYLIKSVVS